MRTLGSQLRPVPAAVMRRMAAMRCAGDSYLAIARTLTREGVPTAAGAPEWTPTAVRSALRSRRGAAALTGAPCDPPPAESAGAHAALGVLVRSHRTTAGLTIREVARHISGSHSTVARLENGRGAPPSPASIAAVLAVLRITPPEAAPLIPDDALRVAVLRAMVAADLSEEEILSAA